MHRVLTSTSTTSTILLRKACTASREGSVYIKVDHNTGVYDPYSLRRVCGFFNIPQY